MVLRFFSRLLWDTDGSFLGKNADLKWEFPGHTTPVSTSSVEPAVASPRWWDSGDLPRGVVHVLGTLFFGRWTSYTR